MADRIGQRLGNYRLTRLLGKGGFAEVYLGEHLRLNTYAAVKVLHTRLASPDDVENFQKEAQTIAHLHHPHIVRVLDFDVVDDTPFLVMDYAPNGTLRQRHPKGTILPLSTIIAYVKQLADALQYAHDQRLIHRDIKPENMLVGGRDELLLSDFGIATVAQSSRYQRTQDMAGTMAYMAPEQIGGKPRPTSDQYSLGIVVYEWLCGERPFQGSFTEIAAQHVQTAPLPLREKVSTLSPEVEQVVLTALAKDPKQRFGSVQAFATALEQANGGAVSRRGGGAADVGRGPLWSPALGTQSLASPSNQAAPPTASETPPSSFASTRPASSNKNVEPPLVVPPVSTSNSIPVSTPSDQPVMLPKRYISRRTVLVGLAGLVVVGGGATWLVLSQPPVGTTLYIYHGHSDTVSAVAWSPNSKRIASIASGSIDGTVQVWDAADGGNVFTYRGHSSFVFAVAWSPDGTRIASGGYGNTVQVWDAADGGNVFIYRGHSNYVSVVTWSPDGTRIASGSQDNTVQVWNAADGSNVFTYRGHSSHVYELGWSPDGKRIASGSDDKTVQVWDAANGGNAYIYHGHSNRVLAVAWSPDGRRIASAEVSDSTVQVWDAADGGNVFTYRGHSDWVHPVAWSPDGRRIASGSIDGTVQTWNAADGGNVYTYHGHSSVVITVAWSPDGKRIASGSSDDTVRVWEAV